MKRLLVIYEGAADHALEQLEGSTPLELARNNNASFLVARGAGGFLEWDEADTPRRTEYRLATLLGVSFEESKLLRRGPVEAAGTAADPGSWTYAYRGNCVPLDDDRVQESRVSDMTRDETVWIADALREALRDQPVSIEVLDDARLAVMFEQIAGGIDGGEFPEAGGRVELEADGSSDRASFMAFSAKVLANQSLNDVRVDLGQNPASLVWLWAGGPPVKVKRPFLGAPLKAAMVTNSPLGKGMARLLGMACLPLGDLWEETPDPQLIDADALKTCVEKHELTVVYVEAPRERGSYGSPVEKVKGIDRIDIHVLGTILKAVDDLTDTRILVTALPEETEHVDRTPVLLCGRDVRKDGISKWHEAACEDGAMGALPADRCLTKLIGD